MIFAIKGIMELRVETEEAANKLHKEYEDYCHRRCFTLSSWTQTYKCKKAQGEIVEEYFVCKPQIIFTDVKNPNVFLTDVAFNVDDNLMPGE